MITKLAAQRVGFFLTLATIAYGFFAYFLFFQQSIVRAGLSYGLLFVLLIFVAIDSKRISNKKFFPALILLALLLQIVFYQQAWQLSLAIWLSLLGIAILYRDLSAYFQNVRKIKWFVYFSQSGYLFTMIATILLAFAMLGVSRQFPFSCEQIKDRNTKMVSTPSQYFPFSKFSDEQITKKEKADSEQDSALQHLRTDLKTNLQNGFFQTQKNINFQICQVVLKELERVYQNPFFQLVVILAVYILFYGVIRIFVWILTLLAYGIFLLLYWFWCYPLQRVQKTVEEVQ